MTRLVRPSGRPGVRPIRLSFAAAVLLVAVTSLLPLSSAGTVITAPYPKGFASVGVHTSHAGCHSSKASHKATFSKSNASLQWANSGGVHTCPTRSGNVTNLTGTESTLELGPTMYLAIPLTVPVGTSSLVTNWSWAMSYSLFYSINGSASCPIWNFTTPPTTVGGIGHCNVDASVGVTIQEFLIDLTNGSKIYENGSVGGGHPSQPLFGQVYLFEDQTINWTCNGSGCTSNNFTAGTGNWAKLSGSLAGSSLTYFNDTLWHSDRYVLSIMESIFVATFTTGYSHAAASVSLDAFTSGQGVRLASISTS